MYSKYSSKIPRSPFEVEQVFHVCVKKLNITLKKACIFSKFPKFSSLETFCKFLFINIPEDTHCPTLAKERKEEKAKKDFLNSHPEI